MKKEQVWHIVVRGNASKQLHFEMEEAKEKKCEFNSVKCIHRVGKFSKLEYRISSIRALGESIFQPSSRGGSNRGVSIFRLLHLTPNPRSRVLDPEPDKEN